MFESAVLTTAMSSMSIAVATQTTARVQRCVVVKVMAPGGRGEERGCRACSRPQAGSTSGESLVGLLATFHPKSAAADHRQAASSILEIPGVFLRICVLAWRRRRPVFRVQRHEKTH